MTALALELNFTAANLDPHITLTRALNTATRVANNGYITTVNADLPRFDYDPVTLACKGLLIEESRSNICTYSETFQNWVATNVSVATNVAGVTSPDGGNTADSVTDNSTSGDHRITQPVTTSTSTTYTASVYVKAGTGNYFFMSLSAGNVDGRYLTIVVDLSTGSVTQTATSTGSTLSSSRVTNAGGGWYRVTMSGSQSLTAVTGLRLGLAASATGNTIGARGTPSYSGTGSVLYIWGAQLEAGAFATSYIPTTTAALTRNADVATITGTNFSDWWQAGKGGVLARAVPSTVSGTRPLIQFDDATADNIIALRGNTTNPELYIVDGGTPQAQINAGTIAANTDYSLTGWWQTNDCKARKDSGAVVTDTMATIPTVTQARLGSDGTNYLNGHLATINYYDQFSGQIYTRRKNKVIFNVI